MWCRAIEHYCKTCHKKALRGGFAWCNGSKVTEQIIETRLKQGLDYYLGNAGYVINQAATTIEVLPLPTHEPRQYLICCVAHSVLF